MSNTMQHAVKRRQLEILAGIDPSHSHFVTGFFTKCAQSGRTPIEALREASMACDVHPAIAREFAKCGFSADVRLKSAGVLDNVGAAVKGFGSNLWNEGRQNLGQGLTNASNGLKGFGTMAAGGLGRAAGLVGQGVGRATDATGLTEGWTEGADSFAGDMDSAVRSGVATLGAGLTGNKPEDFAASMRSNGFTGTQSVDNMRGRHLEELHDANMPTRQIEYRRMAQERQQASTPAERDALKIQHQQTRDQLDQNPIAGAYNLLNRVGDTGLQTATVARAVRPLANVGAATRGVAPATRMTQLANSTARAAPALTAYNGAGGEAFAAGVETAVNPGEGPITAVPGEFAQNTPSYQQGEINPRVPVAQKGTMDETGEQVKILGDGRSIGESQIDQTGLAPKNPAFDPATAQDPPVAEPTMAPPDQAHEMHQRYLAEHKQVAEQAPEQAAAAVEQAGQQLTPTLQTPEGKQVVDEVMQTGQTPAAVAEAGKQKLTEELGDPAAAEGMFAQMSPWEHVGLWGGLGMGALGLINAMSGEGGIGSWMMSLLGLGAAGLTAANAGMFGGDAQEMAGGVVQGGKDLAGGVSDLATGSGVTGEVPGYVKTMLQGMDHVPDAEIKPMLQTYADSNPDVAKQLDRASGHGSWGNSFMSFMGDISGQKDRLMEQKLGLNPEQNKRLLQLWKQIQDSR